MNGQRNKKPKIFIIAAAIVITAGAIACSFSPAAKQQNDMDIYGFYEFEENIFTNPLSSFLPLKGFMPFYEISENTLRIIDNNDGSVQWEYTGSFSKEPIDKKEFKAMFEIDILVPDISRYKECYQFAVFTDTEKHELRLYSMDDEIWLVNLLGNNIWSIYKLIRTDSADQL